MHRPMLAVAACLLFAAAGCGGAAPAVTVAPTELAAAPTNTSRPAPTKRPATEAPTVDASAEAVALYIRWAGGVVGDGGRALKAAGAELALAGADQSLMLDADWIKSAGAALREMVVVSEKIKARQDVPEEAQTMHAEMLTVAGHLSEAATLWAEGIDERNTAKILAGTSIAGEDMPATIARLSAEMDKLTGE